VLATHLRGHVGLPPGAQVALKFDFVPEAGQADAALLPQSTDSRQPLSDLTSSVLREAHAYCQLLGGCGPAPPGAPVPSFAVPFICEVRIGHELAQPSEGCTKAYEGRFVNALALPRLGRSVYAIGSRETVTQAQALKLGAQRPLPAVSRRTHLTSRAPGAKMITAVQWVHERGLLHLDVKPVSAVASCLARVASQPLICFGLPRSRRTTSAWQTIRCL